MPCAIRVQRDVGSSVMTSSGAPISARAAATRCCWPTLSSVTGRRSNRSRRHVEVLEQAQRLRFTLAAGTFAH